MEDMYLNLAQNYTKAIAGGKMNFWKKIFFRQKKQPLLFQNHSLKTELWQQKTLFCGTGYLTDQKNR
jgi:hypothetical protein